MAAMIGGLFAVYMIHKWYDISFMPIETRKIRNDIRTRLLVRAKQTEYARFDDSEFFNLYTRCIQEGEDRCLNVVGTLCAFVTALFSIFGLTAIILTLNPLLIVISLVLLVLNIGISIFSNKLDYGANTDRLPIERQNDYIKRLFYQKQFAKEIKVFSLDQLFLNGSRRFRTISLVM